MTRSAPARYGAYVFGTEDGRLVKIGKAENVAQRLQGGIVGPTGERLLYLADVRGYTRVERHLHELFLPDRLAHPTHREWFHRTSRIDDFVAAAASNWRLSELICPRAVRLDAFEEALRVGCGRLPRLVAYDTTR